MDIKEVTDNCDPDRLGRVFADGKWYNPIALLEDDGKFFIPNIGDHVVVANEYYIGTTYYV